MTEEQIKTQIDKVKTQCCNASFFAIENEYEDQYFCSICEGDVTIQVLYAMETIIRSN